MKLRDKVAWQEWVDNNPLPEGFNDDPNTWPEKLTDEQMGAGYGACVIIAARWWMEQMETLLDEEPESGVDRVAEVAFQTVEDRLGRWGLTGFQYGATASIVAKSWEYGEEFRRWYNLDTQIGDEGERANDSGGVLNPAMLNIGP